MCALCRRLAGRAALGARSGRGFVSRVFPGGAFLAALPACASRGCSTTIAPTGSTRARSLGGGGRLLLGSAVLGTRSGRGFDRRVSHGGASPAGLAGSSIAALTGNARARSLGGGCRRCLVSAALGAERRTWRLLHRLLSLRPCCCLWRSFSVGGRRVVHSPRLLDLGEEPRVRLAPAPLPVRRFNRLLTHAPSRLAVRQRLGIWIRLRALGMRPRATCSVLREPPEFALLHAPLPRPARHSRQG